MHPSYEWRGRQARDRLVDAPQDVLSAPDPTVVCDEIEKAGEIALGIKRLNDERTWQGKSSTGSGLAEAPLAAIGDDGIDGF